MSINKDSNSKIVLICESHSDFHVNKEGKDYILEGIFAELGVENGNGRIYDEKEYLPHLDYLNKRIKKGNLVGELDHPEKFDISLSKISHIIEHLEYNADKRQILGRIRLLNTEAGKNAKAMIDDGVSLSISSRAAGVVKENKKVQIKKIFTYDLVAEPGFENAQLNLMNDSLGISEDSSLKIFEFSDLTQEMLSWLIDDENSEKQVSEALLNDNNENKKNIKNTMTDEKDRDNYVTVEQLDEYSKFIKEKITFFDNALSEKDTEIIELKTLVEQHKEYSEYLRSKIDEKQEIIENVVEYTNYVADCSNDNIEKTDNLVSFADTIVERTNQLQDYQEYICENVDSSIAETENIIKFADYISESVDSNIQYVEHVAENVQLLSEHGDHLAENVNNIANFGDYLSEKLETSIKYQEYVAKEVNENLNENNIVNIEKVEENTSESLSQKIDKILENAKKQNAASTSEKVFGFSLLSEEKQREFTLLDADQKQRIINAVNKTKPVTEQHFNEIWNDAVNPVSTDKIYENIINEMPNEYKPVWDRLNEQEQYTIMQQASMYKLNTPYQIKNFWQTRTNLNQALQMQKLNEDLTADKIKGEEHVDESKNSTNLLNAYYGYNNQHIAEIGSIISRRF